MIYKINIKELDTQLNTMYHIERQDLLEAYVFAQSLVGNDLNKIIESVKEADL